MCDIKIIVDIHLGKNNKTIKIVSYAFLNGNSDIEDLHIYDNYNTHNVYENFRQVKMERKTKLDKPLQENLF